MLEETRQALELSRETGPYVLFPHSMSGLEAIYWAQKHPDEVKAIIGLDPCTPEAVEILPEPEKTQLYAMYLVSRAGITRFMPDSDLEVSLPLIGSEDLSDEDKQKYVAAFYRSALSKDMLSEMDYLKDNAKTVAEIEIPINTPMYFFISDDQEARVKGWKDALSDYLAQLANGKSMHLATGHYVHYEESEVIAEEAKAFLDGIR